MDARERRGRFGRATAPSTRDRRGGPRAEPGCHAARPPLRRSGSPRAFRRGRRARVRTRRLCHDRVAPQAHRRARMGARRRRHQVAHRERQDPRRDGRGHPVRLRRAPNPAVPADGGDQDALARGRARPFHAQLAQRASEKPSTGGVVYRSEPGGGDGQAVRHRPERRGVGPGRAAPAGGEARRAPPRHVPPLGGERDLLLTPDRLPVAPAAAWLPSPEHGLPLLRGVAPAGRVDPIAVGAAQARPRGGRSARVSHGRGHGRAVGQDHGARRRARLRRPQAGEGAQAPHPRRHTLGLPFASRVEPACVSDRVAGCRLVGGLRFTFPTCAPSSPTQATKAGSSPATSRSTTATRWRSSSAGSARSRSPA